MAYRSAKSYYERKKQKSGHATPLYRGGLVWHGTGSGKTITGLGIIMRYLKLCDMLEKRNLPAPFICVVTTQSNSRQNGMDKYLQNLMTYYPEYAHELAREEYPTIGAGETVRIFEALKNVFTKRVRFFNYVTFASCAGLYRRNNIQNDELCKEMRKHALGETNREPGKPWHDRGVVLLLDESHELVKADMKDWKDDDTDSKKNEYQAILRTKKLLEKNSQNPYFHTYCLTATPGTSIEEYVDTLNLVRPFGQVKFTGRMLGSGAISPPLKNYVNYVNLEKDKRYFAPTSKTTIQTPLCKEHYLMTLGFIAKHLGSETIQRTKYLEEGKKTGAQPAQLVYRHYTREAYLAHARRLENWISVSEFDQFVGGCFITGEKKTKKVPAKKVLDKIATLYYTEIWKMAGGNQHIKKWIENIFPVKGKAYMRLKLTTSKTKTETKMVIVSPKLFRVAMTLHINTGKQYVFSNDTGSNEIIAKMLDAAQYHNITESVRTLKTMYTSGQNQHGISMLNNGRTMSGNSGTTSGQTRRSNGKSHYRNYILVRDKAGKDIETFQAYMSGLNMIKEGTKRVVESGTVTKFKRNVAGQACKIIFVTGELFTGTDINALRGVHLVNPMASHISKVQAHGRASRSRGHTFLPESNQNSTIYTYISVVRRFQEKYTRITVSNVMKCFAEDRKKTDKFTAALQWLQSKVKVNGIRRVGGKNTVNTNNDSTFLPTADSATDAQQVYDYNTQKMLKFETSLKGRLRK